ncbi:MAG: hypothetical protein ABH914_02900 [Candidatus Omnitrophota bacterium]
MSSKEDLDFEISFYEKILEQTPNFVNALIVLGEAYTRKGRYKDGLRVDRRLVKLRPQDEAAQYNLACSYSLLEMPEPCLGSLKKAINFGYSDFTFMEQDPDLEFIRKDPRYRELLSQHTKLTR